MNSPEGREAAVCAHGKMAPPCGCFVFVQPAPTAPPPAAPPEVQDTKRALLAKLRAIQSCAKAADVFGALDYAARFAWEAEALFDKLCAPVAAAPSEARGPDEYEQAAREYDLEDMRKLGTWVQANLQHHAGLSWSEGIAREFTSLRAQLATAEAERDRLLRFVTEGNAIVERHTETRATGCVDQYRMPWSHSWFDTPEAAVADWLGRAPSTGRTP